MPDADSIQRTRQALLDDGVILCLRLADADALRPACAAALRGGLRVFEITLTTPGALAAIADFSARDDALVGAGTALAVADVEAVAEAGGRFVLSPVCDPELLDAARRLGLLAVPGAATPREILAAHRRGASLVKVFPAAALGGPDYLRALRGPLGHIPLVPTSGPSAANMVDYVDAGAVAVGVGAEVFPVDFTEEHVEAAARRVRAAMDAARGSGRP
jgi:2-dehydro-3-deoxyphosphogluconate aldolase/(4S)-4-hydroxy-2-oxoglutarate aldolase